MKRLIEIIILAGIVFGAYRGLEVMRSKKAELPQKEVIRPVKTVTLRSNGKGGLWQYYGTLQGGKRVDLSFRVSGPISNINVEKGASVKKGQLLATLDPRDFRTQLKQAQSSQAQAQAQYENAQADFKRYENLYKQKVIPRSTYDTYKTQMNVALSALNAARASTAAVRDSLKDTELRAPFDGVIVDRMVESFQDVTAKQTIFILQDISMLEIVFNVPENDVIWASKATSSTPDSIRAKFDAIPDRTFPLTVKEFVLQADSSTNTFPVTAVMPQQKDVSLLPGMTATVEVEITDEASREKVFTVPQTAVVTNGDENYVWRVENNNNNNIVKRINVKQNTPHNNGFIEVASEQLRDGDIIIVAGAHLLHEGQKVRM